MNDKATAKTYRRALAAANAKLGWAEVPDCPMEIFAQILAERERAHPEQAVPTMEYRARVFSESAWRSEKVLNIQPASWIPEYSWLYSLALADGTFEAAPRLVWMTAYVGRPDWTVEQVSKLLDELERVGLLERRADENGKVWGRWVGSEKFLPTNTQIEQCRYKTGRGDLFEAWAHRAAPAPRRSSNVQQHAATSSNKLHVLGVGVGEGCGIGTGLGTGLDSAAKSSENEQQTEQVKNVRAEDLLPNTVEPKPEDFTNRLEYSRACHAAGVLPVARAASTKREPLERGEFEIERDRPKVAAAVADAFGLVPNGAGGWKKPENRQEQKK
jgi:hypothetical protein